MDAEKLDNQIPLLRFLNKHKWRIIVPILFCVIYFGLPRYFREMSAPCQYYLFISSAQNAAPEQLNREVVEASERILSDESLRDLLVKYDLFPIERSKGMDEHQLIGKMRIATRIEPDTDNTANGAMVYVWAHFWNDDPQKVFAVSNEIASRFEQQSNFRVMKYIAKPYDYNPWRGYVLLGSALQGATFSLLFILIWEIPFMFYSQKTNEMVFDPLRSDWQNELLDARLRKQTWRALKINIRYSYAFLATLLLQSPVGDLIEIGRKFAK